MWVITRLDDNFERYLNRFAKSVIRALNELVELRGAPRRLRLDNVGQNLSVQHYASGLSNTVLSWFTSNRGSPLRTPTLNASPAPFEPKS
jgi:hypothetical protein